MARHNVLGKMGEAAATTFLLQKGYEIVAQNWRYKRAEIDIIAKDNRTNTLIFVEVKARSTDAFGKPEEFITPRKEALIADAASVYCYEVKHDWAVRFDVIAVIIQKENVMSIRHFEDVFFP